VTQVVIYPNDWNGQNHAAQNKCTASAAAHGIALTVGPMERTNPDQLLTISDDDLKSLAAPYYSHSVPFSVTDRSPKPS
jgi:hypothetical protein